MKPMKNDFYRVVASTPSRDPYPVYKYWTDPKEWSCNVTVSISCEDGVVHVKIFEKDSIKIHELTVEGTGHLTEQLEHPDRP